MDKEILFKFTALDYTVKELTCSVLQAAQMLTILNAELARILNVQCQDIGHLLDAKSYIEENSEQMSSAVEFIHFYNLLHDYFMGDAVEMRHWLRVKNKRLKGIPLFIIIDEHRINDMILFLESPRDKCSQ